MTKHLQDRIGKGLVSGGLGIALAIGVCAAVYVAKLPKYDARGCIVGQPAAAYTAVIVDMTDPLTEQQVAALLVRLRRLVATELSPNEMLSIWALGDFPDGALHPIFCLCDPGADVNPLVQSARAVRARRDSLFGEPLERAMHELTVVRTAARSPILEGVEEVTELEDFVATQGRKRILLASDLLQNSSWYSTYRDGSRLDVLAHSEALQSLKGRLSGVAVNIIYIPRKRDAARQGVELRSLWRRALEMCGASRVSFERL